MILGGNNHVNRKYIHDLTLMLMYLTRFSEQSRLPIPMQPMAWKGYDFDTLNALEDERLIAQGHIRRGQRRRR